MSAPKLDTVTTLAPPADQNPRGHWGRQWEFILSCFAYTIGLGNIWRFPYVCMKNGGGAFLVPYFTMLFLCGIPLYFMELCVGQFSGLSCLTQWHMCPLFKGVGWGMVTASLIVSIYGNVMFAWILYYLGMSLRKELPWNTCDNPWNTPDCRPFQPSQHNTSLVNSTELYPSNSSAAKSVSATEEFWSYKVLDISDGIDDLGSMKWDLVLCSIAACVIFYACLCRGIKSSGKVVYVTATLPYLLLTVLFIRGVTLPGSRQGVEYYIIPDWSKLTSFAVWVDASQQIFYSLGPGWGGLITMASYNRIDNDCLRQTFSIGIGNGLTSLFAGFAVFSVLGHMAFKANVPVAEVVSQGPGLAFIAYPEAISTLPFAPFWSVCFFLMLLSAGVDSRFVSIECIITGVVDEFPNALRKRRYLLPIAVMMIIAVLSLPFLTRGGMYLFQVFDWYASMFCIIVFALMECIAVFYIYGSGRFYHDVYLMVNVKLHKIWTVLWCGFVPVILLTVLIAAVVNYNPPQYKDYTYPDWAIGLGWSFAAISLLPIPLVAVYRTLKRHGSLFERMQAIILPDSAWLPQDQAIVERYRSTTNMRTWKQRMTIPFASSDYIYNVSGDVELSAKETCKV